MTPDAGSKGGAVPSRSFVREEVKALNEFEEAAVRLLTLVEGLEREELSRSRVTRHEATKCLRASLSSLLSLPPEARAELAEVDWEALGVAERRIESGEGVESEFGWFTTHALVPAALEWLRFSRAKRPELFVNAGAILTELRPGVASKKEER